MSTSKFCVSAAAFAKALAFVAPVVPTNPVAPILENVLLIGTGSVVGTAASLQLVCSNFETTITTTLAVEAVENFALCVPAKKLLATLRALPDGPVTCEVNAEDYTFNLALGRSRYKLAGENPAGFFKPLPVERLHERIEMPAYRLREALAAALVATSTDTLREALCCVLLDASKEYELRVVGCDGHSVCVYEADAFAEDEEITWTRQQSNGYSLLIPRQSAQLLVAQLDPKSHAPVVLLADASTIRTEAPGWISRLSDERYPEYRAVIRTFHHQRLEVDHAELAGALRRLKAFTPRQTDLFLLELNPDLDTAELRADDLGVGDHGTEQVAASYEGDPMTLAFPASRMLQVLDLWAGQRVRFRFDGTNAAVFISAADEEVEDPALMCLVMPVPIAVAQTA